MLVLAGRVRIVLRALTLAVVVVGHDVLLAPGSSMQAHAASNPKRAPGAWQALSMSNFDAAGAEHHNATARAANCFLKRLHAAPGVAQRKGCGVFGQR